MPRPFRLPTPCKRGAGLQGVGFRVLHNEIVIAHGVRRASLCSDVACKSFTFNLLRAVAAKGSAWRVPCAKALPFEPYRTQFAPHSSSRGAAVKRTLPAVLTAFVTAVTMTASAQMPDDVGERAKGAKKVVVATVTDVESEFGENDYGDRLILSRVSMRVDETMKGRTRTDHRRDGRRRDGRRSHPGGFGHAADDAGASVRSSSCRMRKGVATSHTTAEMAS